MENWKELLASFGLWLLVEDISDDGDGEGDNLQLTKDGELFVSEIQQELDRAREEGTFTKEELEGIGELLGFMESDYPSSYWKPVYDKIKLKLTNK